MHLHSDGTASVPLKDLRPLSSEPAAVLPEEVDDPRTRRRVRFSLPGSWKVEVPINVQALEMETPLVHPSSPATPLTPLSPWGRSSRSSRLSRKTRALTVAVRSGILEASGRNTRHSGGRSTEYSGRSTAYSGRSRARSSVTSMGYADAQPSDPRRRPCIWLSTFLVTYSVVATPLIFLTRQGKWCFRLEADAITWLVTPFFAAGLLAAFIDNRGRYCEELLLHSWMWKEAQTAYVGAFGSTMLHMWLAMRKCEIPGFNLPVMGITFCGTSWVLSTVLLNFCIVLKLRMLEQHRVADKCYLLLKIQAALAIPGAIGYGFRFCRSIWKQVGTDWMLQISLILSIIGVLAIIVLLPFFYFAYAAMQEVANMADEDIATGAVPLHERAEVRKAASWTRITAAATKASGFSILLISVAIMSFHFRTSQKYETDWTLLFLNISVTVDFALNSACAALLSGLVGPRLHFFDAKVSLLEAGKRLEARRKRDAEEMELANAQLESLHLIPVSDGLQQELHRFERALSDSYKSQMSIASQASSATSIATSAVSYPSDSTEELSEACYMTPEAAQELFEKYRSRCDAEMARMMDLMQSCCSAYQVLTERWKYITEIQNFVDEGFSTQTVPQPKPPPDGIEEGVDAYFVDLYGCMAAATDAFHQQFGLVVEEFQRANNASDINLDDEKFPFVIHRKGVPKVQSGPLKTMDRARAKYEEKPDGKTSWPPKAATLLDLIRTTVLFQDPYDLAVFFVFMRSRFRVVRVKNRFKDFDPNLPGGFRNVHTNIVFYHNDRPLIVEVQLHLWALFVAAKMIHGAYEVVRAETLAEVVGPPYKWSDDHADEHQELIMSSQTTKTSKKKRAIIKSSIPLPFGKSNTYTPSSTSSRERLGTWFKGLMNPRSVVEEDYPRSMASTTSW